MVEAFEQLKIEVALLLVTAWTWLESGFTVQNLGRFNLILHALTSVFVFIIAGYRALQIIRRHRD